MVQMAQLNALFFFFHSHRSPSYAVLICLHGKKVPAFASANNLHISQRILFQTF